MKLRSLRTVLRNGEYLMKRQCFEAFYSQSWVSALANE